MSYPVEPLHPCDEAFFKFLGKTLERTGSEIQEAPCWRTTWQVMLAGGASVAAVGGLCAAFKRYWPRG